MTHVHHWASELDHGAMDEVCLVWWIMLSFKPVGWLGACLVYLRKRCIMARRQAGVLCSGQCSAGNPGSWQLCYFDMYHLPKDCCRPQTPLHGNGVSCWLWPGLCTLPHCKNSLGMVWGTRVQGVALASKLPRSQSICVTIICVIQSTEASPHNLQDLKEWFTQKLKWSFTHPQAIHVYAFLLSDEYNRSYIK